MNPLYEELNTLLKDKPNQTIAYGNLNYVNRGGKIVEETSGLDVNQDATSLQRIHEAGGTGAAQARDMLIAMQGQQNLPTTFEQAQGAFQTKFNAPGTIRESSSSSFTPGQPPTIAATKSTWKPGPHQNPLITSSQGKSPIQLTQAIQQQTQPVFSLTGGMLKQGVFNNENVKQLQTLLGITADGDFGPQTKVAVIAFQQKNGLTPDGVVGPLTAAALAKMGQGNTNTQQPIYDNKTGFLTPYGQSVGAKPVSPQDPHQAPVGGVSTGTGGVADSGSARTNMDKAIADMKARLGMGDAPEAQDLFSSQDEKNLALARNDKTAIESELADIQGAKMALEDEFRKYKVQSAKEISMGGYEGGLSEKSRELQFQSDTLARKEFVLETKLSSRNNTINELMRNQQLDYASAVDAYNTKFSQSLQLYGILEKEQDELVTNAKASADLIINSMQGNSTPPTTAQLRNWAELETQGNLPQGYIQSMVQKASQSTGFEYKGTIGGAESGWNSIWINPTTGEQKIMVVKGGTGGGGTTVKNEIITKGEAKLNASRGEDGWVDPYLYKQAYDDWVTDKMGTTAQFLAKFPPKNYVNPKATFLPDYLQNKTKSSGRSI